ncbi:hypothetical protein DPMN_150553 [Dreissena polymorpha]|uniref:Uncharacterized protein n=1 Tax=Dreissena polymorpha TaxID=45954 RepID=A0A9D4FES9_DREPO|nr:hypothetical protein DPMN_150553 [Dreissena polymorpha]
MMRSCDGSYSLVLTFYGRGMTRYTVKLLGPLLLSDHLTQCRHFRKYGLSFGLISSTFGNCPAFTMRTVSSTSAFSVEGLFSSASRLVQKETEV